MWPHMLFPMMPVPTHPTLQNNNTSGHCQLTIIVTHEHTLSYRSFMREALMRSSACAWKIAASSSHSHNPGSQSVVLHIVIHSHELKPLTSILERVVLENLRDWRREVVLSNRSSRGGGRNSRVTWRRGATFLLQALSAWDDKLIIDHNAAL